MADAHIQEADVSVLAQPPTNVRIAEADVSLLGHPPTGARIAFASASMLAYRQPCATTRCQLWSVERRDGTVLRFTSHDVDVTWGVDTYQACASLSASASEQSHEAGSIGNIELDGIIASDAISEADLYAGKYDDAYWEVWLVSWGDDADIPERLAAGLSGQVSQGEQGFKAEVLGAGARLLQRPLLRTVTPSCGWKFGNAASGCPVDAEALKTTGAVTAARSRQLFTGDQVDPGGAQFDRGTVRWTSGDNDGIECEVMTVDFATGVVVLWEPAPFVPAIGDAFDLLPGCDLAYTGGCTLYGATLDFGGFKDTPGQDAISKTPDVKS